MKKYKSIIAFLLAAVLLSLGVNPVVVETVVEIVVPKAKARDIKDIPSSPELVWAKFPYDFVTPSDKVN